MHAGPRLALAATACAMPPGPIASAQEAAQELNLDARFGRTEIAMDHVAPAARDAFTAHHRAWGTSVRIADVELAGVRAHGEHDVDILVHVAWYRPEEQELHLTTLKQGWNDKNGWQLASEARIDGDVGSRRTRRVRSAARRRAPARPVPDGAPRLSVTRSPGSVPKSLRFPGWGAEVAAVPGWEPKRCGSRMGAEVAAVPGWGARGERPRSPRP